jgi:hypothetical protein
MTGDAECYAISTAIVWRIPDRVRGGQDDDPFLVRHIHDLAILKDAALQHGDFSGLVATSAQSAVNQFTAE